MLVVRTLNFQRKVIKLLCRYCWPLNSRSFRNIKFPRDNYQTYSSETLNCPKFSSPRQLRLNSNYLISYIALVTARRSTFQFFSYKPACLQKNVHRRKLPIQLFSLDERYTNTWRGNILEYLSAVIICSEKWTVFQERSSRKTVSFEEWCPRTNIRGYFRPRWRLLCLLSFTYFFSQHARFGKLGNITRIFPRFSWSIFSFAFKPIARERKYLMDYIKE